MNPTYLIIAAALVFLWPNIKKLGLATYSKVRPAVESAVESATTPAAVYDEEELNKFFSKEKYHRVAFLMMLRKDYMPEATNPDEYALAEINHLIRLETNTEDGSEYIEEEETDDETN